MTAYTRVWGPGRTLLIHAALAHSGVLETIANTLPGGAVAFDLPGHGRSPAWDEAQEYQSQCIAWAAETAPERCHVFGHSFGATVALRYAVEHPKRVTGLTLFEPVYFAAMRLHDPEADAAYLSAFAPIQAAWDAGELELMAERFTEMWGGSPLSKLPGRFRTQLARQMPLIIAQGRGIYDDMGDVFAPGRLEALDIPVTLIRGSDTQPSVDAIHAVLMKLLPRASEHVLPGIGHMGPVTHPKLVAPLIRL